MAERYDTVPIPYTTTPPGSLALPRLLPHAASWQPPSSPSLLPVTGQTAGYGLSGFRSAPVQEAGSGPSGSPGPGRGSSPPVGSGVPAGPGAGPYTFGGPPGHWGPNATWGPSAGQGAGPHLPGAGSVGDAGPPPAVQPGQDVFASGPGGSAGARSSSRSGSRSRSRNLTATGLGSGSSSGPRPGSTKGIPAPATTDGAAPANSSSPACSRHPSAGAASHGSAAGRSASGSAVAEPPAVEAEAAAAAPPAPSYYAHLGYSGAGGGLAAAAQAAYEVQQAALRTKVARDIGRMLAGSKAYQHHVKGPPVLSAEALGALAQPKQRPGGRTDPQSLVHIPDPVDWARWKTEQLAISRLTEERRQAEAAEEKRQTEEQLARFRQMKAEAKQAKADAKARAAAEEAAYRAQMSSYLNHRGALDLEDFKRRKEEDQERLALARSRRVRGLSTTHHY